MSAEKIKELQEEIGRTFEEVKKYNDRAIEEAEKRHGEASTETLEKVEAANNAVTEMRKEMTELSKRLNRPNFENQTGNEQSPEEELRAAAFEKYIRYGIGETGQAVFTPDEKRALGGTSDADGGFLIPPSFESGIIMNAYNLAEVRPACQVGSTGRDVVMLGALSKPSVAWGRANIGITAQDLATGGERITIFDLRALTLISNNTLDDTDANIVGEMTDAFARAIAEAEDDGFSTGPGADSPKGFIADSRVQANYAASGVAAALSDETNNGVDSLIECFYSPKKTYRKNGRWAFNSTTESVIRKLKDGEGRYLWQPSVIAGEPATLLGKAIMNPEGMPDIAAGSFPIVFGDFMAGYKIRDRSGITVQRLVERYAEYDQTGFIIKKRLGGQVTLVEAFACVKIAAS
jgi:HK97 family phage major capsid protein